MQQIAEEIKDLEQRVQPGERGIEGTENNVPSRRGWVLRDMIAPIMNMGIVWKGHVGDEAVETSLYPSRMFPRKLQQF